jgi:hypothetical protein
MGPHLVDPAARHRNLTARQERSRLYPVPCSGLPVQSRYVRRIDGNVAGLVSAQGARPSVAANSRSIRHMGRRGHASTDASGDGYPLLSAVDGDVSAAQIACRSRLGRRDVCLGRSGLLSKSHAAPTGGEEDSDGSRASASTLLRRLGRSRLTPTSSPWTGTCVECWRA